MKRLILIEYFNNYNLLRYSDGSCYQQFSNGRIWKIF